jgi:hypothetical protein
MRTGRTRLISRQSDFSAMASNPQPRRLIDAHSFTLVEFEESEEIPPYAILSHRWIYQGGQLEEVTYREFQNIGDTVMQKSGYAKIEATCHRALQDGLQYVWVDTCCVKQGDHDDVARNIRSMFPYYQNAYICYVYLVDVCLQDDAWRSRFTHSEWFQRGWTLQELLAPGTVDFFDREWNYIGSKLDLKDIIAHVTTIPADIISGEQSIHDIHPLRRMSWTIGRQTSRSPDRAYCLAGLLGVSIEPDYTEDLRQSMNRLWATFLHSNPKYEQEIGPGFSLFDFIDSARVETRLTALDIQTRAIQFLEAPKSHQNISRGQRAHQLKPIIFHRVCYSILEVPSTLSMMYRFPM